MTIDTQRKISFGCPVPDGIEFRLGEADPNGLALPANGTLLRTTALLPVHILIVLIQNYLLLFTNKSKNKRVCDPDPKLRPSGAVFPFGDSQSEGFHAMKT